MQNTAFENIVVSRYFVLKQSLLLSSKRLLQVTTNSIILDTLPVNTSAREIIEWKNFKDCAPVEQKDKKHEDDEPPATNDVYLIYLKEDKTEQQIKLTCTERLNLISDIFRCFDQYRLRVSDAFEKEIPIIEGLRELPPSSRGTTFSVVLRIYRTFIEIVHKRLNPSTSDPTIYKKLEVVNPPPLSMPYNDPATTVIPYTYIEKFERTTLGMNIVAKESQRHYSFIFMDMERTHRIIERIRASAKKHLAINIPYVPLDQAEPFQSRELSPEAIKNFFFQCPVYKVLRTGELMPIILAADEADIFEIDPESFFINEKIQMQGVLDLVRFEKELIGFQLILRHLEIITYIAPPNSRDIMVTSMLAILKMQKAEKSSVKVHEFISSSIPPLNLQVKGLPDGELDKDYLVSLFKSLCIPVNDTQFYYTLREFNLYPSILSYSDHDPLPLEFISLLFKKYAAIITTPEFNSFASTFSRYVKARMNLAFSHRPPSLNPDLIDPQLSETEHRKEIEQLEKELNTKVVSFKYADDDTKPLLELTHVTFPELVFKVEELLKALTILMTSRPYFRDFASAKKQKKFYTYILESIVLLLDSEWPSLAAHAASFLNAFIKFPTDEDPKFETLNIKFLVTDVHIMKKISECLTKRVLVKAPSPYLQEDPHIINICSCLRVIKAIIYDRRESVTSEDLYIIMVFLTMPYYFAMFNFLSRYRSFSCSFKASLILNAIIQNVDTKEKYKKMQDYILNHSSLILYHTNIALYSHSALQKQLSVILLSHIFRDSANACALIVRIFPKPLFRKVEATTTDISKWTLSQWEEFFEIVRKNYNTATEQWGDECRIELMSKLERADKDVVSKHRYLKSEEIPQLFEPAGSLLCDKLLEIRWNHEEFEMKYDILRDKILVWKYYLTHLIKEGEHPHLTVNIHQTQHAKFWTQLNIRFISSSVVREQMKILKTLILMYKQHFPQIKDLSTMSYWLKIAVSREYRECRYLIIQLLYTAMTLEDSGISRTNLKRFIDLHGVKKLTDLLAGLHFAEDHNRIYTEGFIRAKRIHYQTHPNEEMLYNYTNLKLEKQAYTESLLKACMINFIIRIYGAVFQKRFKEELLLFPPPKAKNQILEKDPISCILNMLLLNDDETRKETLEYLLTNLCDRFSYKSLAFGTPLYEFLIVNLTNKTTKLVGQLLIALFQQLKEDFGGSYGKVIADYISTTFESLNTQTIETAHKIFPILKYLPKHLFWILTNKGAEEFEKILFSQQYESPELVWRAAMLKELKETIDEKVQAYRVELIRYSDNVEVHSASEMPKFHATFGPFQYQDLLVTSNFFFLSFLL